MNTGQRLVGSHRAATATPQKESARPTCKISMCISMCISEDALFRVLAGPGWPSHTLMHAHVPYRIQPHTLGPKPVTVSLLGHGPLLAFSYSEKLNTPHSATRPLHTHCSATSCSHCCAIVTHAQGNTHRDTQRGKHTPTRYRHPPAARSRGSPRCASQTPSCGWT